MFKSINKTKEHIFNVKSNELASRTKRCSGRILTILRLLISTIYDSKKRKRKEKLGKIVVQARESKYCLNSISLKGQKDMPTKGTTSNVSKLIRALGYLLLDSVTQHIITLNTSACSFSHHNVFMVISKYLRVFHDAERNSVLIFNPFPVYIVNICFIERIANYIARY